ncbi:WW domain-binding protein 11-like isoform X4 [Corvus hawaiiensis]|uniref:WW domain-binding protein 11-like isoform X4 n=1 Tax=Corvus hawaiiensis TaxID=134902 RepID=UPI0020192916|nr:WW domain-binding protein 11-like isoform X4 [Corvus hawaiiensis]
MGQPEPPGVFDLGVLRTPRGLLLAGELVLSGGVVALLAPPAPPTLAPALLQTLAGAAALGGLLLRDPPQLPPGYGTCLRPLSRPPGPAPGGQWDPHLPRGGPGGLGLVPRRPGCHHLHPDTERG